MWCLWGDKTCFLTTEHQKVGRRVDSIPNTGEPWGGILAHAFLPSSSLLSSTSSSSSSWSSSHSPGHLINLSTLLFAINRSVNVPPHFPSGNIPQSQSLNEISWKNNKQPLTGLEPWFTVDVHARAYMWWWVWWFDVGSVHPQLLLSPDWPGLLGSSTQLQAQLQCS